MKTVYISSDTIEDLIITKAEIENTLIEDTKNTSSPYMKKNINEFISGIDFISNVFVHKKTVIPFSMMMTSKEAYLFIAGMPDSPNNKILLDALDAIDYDVTRLVSIPTLDIVNDTSLIEKNDFFLIKGDYKRLP